MLRVLQGGEFERIGGIQSLKVDVRVIAATNRDLDKLVEEKDFREDLYYRLNVFPLSLPPLRGRSGDIALIVRHFVEKYSKKIGKQIDTIPQKVMATLQAYDWPGNVRELENVIERALILAQGATLHLDDALGSRRKTSTSTTAMLTLEDVERQHIRQVLEQTHWRIEGQRGAALRLGMNPSTLRSRMRKLGIEKPTLAG